MNKRKKRVCRVFTELSNTHTYIDTNVCFFLLMSLNTFKSFVHIIATEVAFDVLDPLRGLFLYISNSIECAPCCVPQEYSRGQCSTID